MYLGESSLDSWVDEPFTGKGIIAVRAVWGVRKEQTKVQLWSQSFWNAHEYIQVGHQSTGGSTGLQLGRWAQQEWRVRSSMVS